MDETEPTGVQEGSALGSWTASMMDTYPDSETGDGDEGADYSSAYPALAYVAAGWDEAADFREVSLRLAASHAVGLFLLSDPVPTLWWPDGQGGLRQVAQFES
ncbi:hypothetical protein [Gordonia effusa]|nr:hypothetical protein [Gordonia effusa]